MCQKDGHNGAISDALLNILKRDAGVNHDTAFLRFHHIAVCPEKVIIAQRINGHRLKPLS
jgi:hypothetical protein